MQLGLLAVFIFVALLLLLGMDLSKIKKQSRPVVRRIGIRDCAGDTFRRCFV